MTNPDCMVCRGRGSIELPLYRPLEFLASNEAMPPDAQNNSRRYVCPECGPMANIERIGVLRHVSARNPEVNDPRYRNAVRADMVRMLADRVLERGWAKFEDLPAEVEAFPPTQEMRAELWVVMPSERKKLEERIAERQLEIASELQAEAKRQIDNWGSYYGRREVSKDNARYLIDEALRVILARRAAWKEVKHEAD